MSILSSTFRSLSGAKLDLTNVHVPRAHVLRHGWGAEPSDLLEICLQAPTPSTTWRCCSGGVYGS